jgi:N-acetylglucosamine-6-phosphate deacetylase
MKRPGQYAVAADFVFDGAIVHRKSAIVLDKSRIVAIVPRAELAQLDEVYDAPAGAWLAPGFIDIQVNGGGDILFNSDPTPGAISKIIKAHRRFGTTSLLPTVISDSDDVMLAAVNAVAAMIPTEPAVLGIHFEGPFLSPEKPGVHRRAFIRRPGPIHLDVLRSLKEGVTVVTLAPEEVGSEFVRKLVAAGVKVSLGHSLATYAQTRAAMAEGLTGFTHLFNAMRPLSAREPGPAAAALESPDAYYGLIVDGVHVDSAMLRLATRGVGHPMLVTDAMPPVGGEKEGFALYGEEILVREGRCATAEGTLAGSAIDMASAVRNCMRLLQLPLKQALRYASTEPANFLGLGHVLGRLLPGYRADIVAFLPDDVSVLATWVAGKKFEEASASN